MNAQPVNLEALAVRLEKVERQNRRLKCLGLGVLAFLGIAFLAGSQQPSGGKGTDTDRFSLRDAQGKERVRVGMGAEGPVLQFLNEQGTEVGGFGIGKEGMSLRLVDARGKVLTGLSVERTGVAIVATDADGRLLVGANALKPDAGLFLPRRERPGRERP